MIKAQRAYEFAVKLYPRAPEFHINLAGVLYGEGQFEASLKEWQEAQRNSPGSGLVYQGFVYSYLALNRVQEAQTLAREAQARGLGSRFSPLLYDLAFYQRDGVEMARQAASGAGIQDVEDTLLARQADTAGYFGQLRKSLDLSMEAADSALRAGKKETAATYEVVCALREAFFGDSADAKLQASRAETIAAGRDLDYGLALVFADTSNAPLAKRLTNELETKFPGDTGVQSNYLPTIRAKLALAAGNPRAAIEALEAAAPYEITEPTESTLYGWGALYPVYVRGESYLAARDGNRAAGEFQKILDHRGLVLYEPIGALVHIQLGRAYAMAGDTAKAKAAYQDFLTLWKEADPDIPILKQAKAEYEKLH
jgi:eukaryotic-like serine/threonine-protein kinase